MWPNPQFPADLVTFTEEILNGKLNFLCSGTFEIGVSNKQHRKTISPYNFDLNKFFYRSILNVQVIDSF